MALPLLYLGLFSHVLMDVRKIPVEEELCTTNPCVFEFPKKSSSNSMIVGYGLDENISFPVATNEPNPTTNDNTKDRVHISGNLEEEDCILLIRNIIKRDNMTYLFHADLGEPKSAFLRENIELSVSDLTPKPELYIPEILVTGEPVTLTCTIQGTCKEIKALFLSWKGPTLSSNTFVSRDSFFSGLHFTLKPEDQGTTFRCHSNFSLDNLARSSIVKLHMVAPTRLVDSSCCGKKTLQCSCSFHGIPTPSVQWWLGGAPVSGSSMDNVLQVKSTALAPWANSTIRLKGEPDIIMKLRCEGKNQYGIHTSSVFLIPDKNSVPKMFRKGLIQGIVYGAIAAGLLFFLLVLLVTKVLKWWEKNQIRKPKKALFLKKRVARRARNAQEV